MRRFCAVFSAAILVGFFGGCDKDAPPPEQPARPIKMMTIGQGQSARPISLPGKVKAARQVVLSFQVSGRLAKLPVSKGQAVAQGELLAELDQRDYKNQFNSAEAIYKERSAYLDRMEEGLKKQVATKLEVDQARRDAEVAKADMDTARKNLEDTTLKAPFAGVVADTFVDNFQDVQAKEKILSLQDATDIEIVVDVPERLMARVKEDNARRLVVRFDALPDTTYPVTVKEFAAEADPQTQTYPVTVTMPAPSDANILPGMTATLIAQPGQADGAPAAGGKLLVPVEAVVPGPEGGSRVWLIDPATMTARSQAVTVGAMTGDSVEILAGLTPGQTIAISGANHLHEGMKVKPMYSNQARPASAPPASPAPTTAEAGE